MLKNANMRRCQHRCWQADKQGGLPLRFGVYTIMVCALFAASSFGQPAAPDDSRPKPEIITPEIIETRRKEAAASELEDAIKARIDELYTQAAQSLKDESDSKTAAERYAGILATAASGAPQVAAPEEFLPESKWPTDSTELEQLLTAANAELAQTRESRTSLETRQRDRTTRGGTIPADRAKAKEKLAELDLLLAAPPPATDLPRVILARRTQMSARRQALTAEVSRYDSETAAYAATGGLLSQQLDQAAQRIPVLTSRVAKLQQAVATSKQREAADAAKDARWLKATQSHPAVKNVADHYQALTFEGRKLAERLKNLRADHENLKADLEKWETQYTRTKDRVTAGGLSSAIGLLLRKQKTELLYLRRNPSAEPVGAGEMRDAQLRLYELQDRRTDLGSTDEEIQAVLDAVGAGVNGHLKEDVSEILEKEKKYLDTLTTDYEAYFNTLGQMDDDQRKLDKLAAEYTEFIDERILWIDSMPPAVGGDIDKVWETVQWMFQPANWVSLGTSLWDDLRSRPWLAMALLLGLVVLIGVQQIARSRVRKIGRQVAENPIEPIRTTLRAAVLTLVIAACWPTFVGLVGWRLREAGTSLLAVSLGHALMTTSWLYLFWEVIRQVCRGNGLADAHFGWDRATVQAIRGSVRILMIPLLLLSLIINATDHYSGFAGNDALGRLAFIAGSLVLAFFLHVMLQPKHVVISRFVRDHPRSVIARSRYFWYALGVGVPLAVAILAAVGYFFTALQLVARLESTFWLLLVAILIHQTLLRWLYGAHVRLQLKIEDEKLAAAQAEYEAAEMAAVDTNAAAEGEIVSTQSLHIQPPSVPDIDLNMVSEQSRSLLRTMMLVGAVIGLWFVWVDVTPALKMLDEVELWSTTVSVTETKEADDGTPRVEVNEKLEPVTLADIGLLVIVVTLTVVAAKNVPGLLEIAVLRHLPLDHGAGFAITTVVRYVIMLVGMIAAATTLGIGWSKVQWLAAAITIGLGFGLQEIFANFVSGLIVLWERPIRVGDIVTVDGVTGMVSQIKMRATTVRNWDRQEYVVPNKEFVTGRLLNWTLSDTVNRIVFNVGIAYGSDTDRARELLQQIIREQPDVLTDPPPIVTFEQFGDSTLNFTIRTFLATMDKRLPTMNSVNTEIHRRFAAAGIEIAFPQQDLHIRSVTTPIPVLQRNNGANGNGAHSAASTQEA